MNSKFQIAKISMLFAQVTIEKLKINGYRSELAKRVHNKGNGIGMYRIQKTLQLNNADLEIIPHAMEYTKKVGDIEYEGNHFKVVFKGQKRWL